MASTSIAAAVSSKFNPELVSKSVGEFLSFVDASPSPFHAVDRCSQRLEKEGFQKLKENEQWTLKQGGKYYFTRNASTCVAFGVGGQFSGGSGFHIVGAHTDSPCLKLKPISAQESQGYLQVGVQTYGGGQWCTWFDRDLSLAGRVICQNADSGTLSQHLVKIDRPILRVPTLAIHLNRGLNTEGFKFNLETHLVPVLATCIKNELDQPATASKTPRSSTDPGAHHSMLLSLLAEELNCTPGEITDFELCLYDVQSSAVGGAKNEFVFAPRLDNLLSTFCGLDALCKSMGSLANERNVRMAVFYDNEEVGSRSFQGADSSLIEHTIRRISNSFAKDDAGSHMIEQAFRRSYVVSADMAHAVHPNYSDKHEARHKPQLHAGPVIKHNANQRYATSAATASVLRAIAKKHQVPLQDFVVKQDMGCGSTIGPMISARSLRTVDIGNPQLSMHSIREMCGTDDVLHSINLFTAFYEDFVSVDDSLVID